MVSPASTEQQPTVPEAAQSKVLCEPRVVGDATMAGVRVRKW